MHDDASLVGPEPDDHVHSDHLLFEKLRHGDALAVKELYLRYYSRLVRFAYGYVRSTAVAEELVQDTFLAIWERREHLSLHETVRVYLYAAVRNRALKAIDHDRVVDQTENMARLTELTLGMGTASFPPDRQLEDDALAAAVARAVARLPERARIALTLRWQHQLPYAEIARIMNVSVAAATIQVSRAREMVIELIRAYTTPR